jgi:hypothetical protein
MTGKTPASTLIIKHLSHSYCLSNPYILFVLTMKHPLFSHLSLNPLTGEIHSDLSDKALRSTIYPSGEIGIRIPIRKPGRAPSWRTVPRRIIAYECYSGRILPKNRNVYHLNGLPDDDRPENLATKTGYRKYPRYMDANVY